jgi:hypothetical protein
MATAPRLTALLPLLPLLLAACGDTPAGQALRGAAPPAQPATVLPGPAEGPALLLLSPRPGLLVPISTTGGRRVWRGDGHVALATEGARIVATAGLPQILMATLFDGPDPLEDPRALLGREVPARRTLDLSGAERDPASMRFGVALDCVLRGAPDGGRLVVEERCTGPGLAFTNRYWADAATGRIQLSEQWVGDGVGMLLIRTQGI